MRKHVVLLSHITSWSSYENYANLSLYKICEVLIYTSKYSIFNNDLFFYDNAYILNNGTDILNEKKVILKGCLIFFIAIFLKVKRS